MEKRILYNVLEDSNIILFFRNDSYVSEKLQETVLVMNYNNNMYTGTFHSLKSEYYDYIQEILQKFQPVATKDIDKKLEMHYITYHRISPIDKVRFKSIIRKGKLKTLLC
jgi:hypothetical protein